MVDGGEEMKWHKEEFEVSNNPIEGEEVQFIALHVLAINRLGIREEDIEFYLRETLEEEESK